MNCTIYSGFSALPGNVKRLLTCAADVIPVISAEQLAQEERRIEALQWSHLGSNQAPAVPIAIGRVSCKEIAQVV